MLNIVEATEVVEGLCEKLADMEFEGCDDENELVANVGDMVTGLMANALGELASVWVDGRDRGKIKPVWAYGTEYFPDIAIEVGEMPAVAIEIRLATREDGVASPVVEAVGRALMYSMQYSYVIVFILDRSESDLSKNWFNSEIESRLWDNHRINLVVRH